MLLKIKKNLNTIILLTTAIFYKDKKKRHSSSPISLFRIHLASQCRSIHFVEVTAPTNDVIKSSNEIQQARLNSSNIA